MEPYNRRCKSLMDFVDRCPADALANVLEHLSTGDIVRFSVLGSKSLTVSLNCKATLWSRVAQQTLSALLPAAAFFRGPTSPSAGFSVPLSDVFPRECSASDDALAVAITRAGSAALGAKWDISVERVELWRHRLFYSSGPLPSLVSACCRVPSPGAETLDAFIIMAKAFSCEICASGVAAERQCAACSKLMCFDCAVRCCFDGAPVAACISSSLEVLRGYYQQEHAKDVLAMSALQAPRCAFALCGVCLDSQPCMFPANRYEILSILSGTAAGQPPELYAPACPRCPDDATRLLCPAHVDVCILECVKCGDMACVDHSCETLPVPICNCFVCQWTICYRDECYDSGRSMRHCVGATGTDGICSLEFVCTDCTDDDGKCPSCGSAVE